MTFTSNSLRSQSSWGPIHTLREAHEKIEALPERIDLHLADGSLVLGDPTVAPFALVSCFQWMVNDS